MDTAEANSPVSWTLQRFTPRYHGHNRGLLPGIMDTAEVNSRNSGDAIYKLMLKSLTSNDTVHALSN